MDIIFIRYIIKMSTEGSSVTFTGRVKWFNNKTGYGFLTIIQDSEWGAAEKVFIAQIHPHNTT